MKILIVSAMFPPAQTGTSFYTRNLAINFCKQNHEVTVVTTNNSHLGRKYPFTIIRLKTLHIPLRNFFKHFVITSFFPNNYRLISNLCHEKKFDAIILVNQYLDIAFPTVYASVKNKIPLFITIGTQLQSLNPIRNNILNFLDKIICGNFIYPYVKKIICWDSEIERYINEIHDKKFIHKTEIIPFSSDDRGTSKIKHSYKLHHQILGIGSIIHHRNFLFNVKVFKAILKQNPNIILKIIGHVYNNQVINLVRKLKLHKNVIITGEINHKEIVNELLKTDLHWMMLNGRYKGLGTANLEAMSLGVPIASNVPNNLFRSHKLRDMYNYVFIDDKSISTSASKILLLLGKKKVRERIGLNGKEFMSKFLTWSKIVPQYIRLINKNK
jgi:glycosyltransferase involved in cell wall biosynthesis